MAPCPRCNAVELHPLYLLTVSDDELLDTEIVMTILGGEIRYRDGEIVRR